MSAYLKLKWKSTSAPSKSEDKKLEDAISKFAGSLPKDKPLVLFFGSYKRLKGKKGKPGKLTRQAVKSLALAKAFNDEDFRVQVALKFCDYYDIDVSNISQKDSPLICHEKAPLLIVYYKDEIVGKMTSGSSKLIYATIAKALDKCGIDIYGLTKDASIPVRGLFNLEKKIYDFDQKYNALAAKNRKKKSKAAEMKLARYREQKTELLEQKGKLQSQITEIIDKYTAKAKESSSG